MSKPYELISQRKKAEQASRIPSDWILSESQKRGKTANNVLDVPRTCGLLSATELDITENYDATALVEAIARGKLKSLDVARSFCKRAAIAHQVTNCLTEISFDSALKRASELDEYYQRNGKTIGPLHGLPISFKDTFKVVGRDASAGIASLAFDPAKVNSPLVHLLLRAGAVLYCKTNIPQTLSALDSHNYVFGRVLNPRNLLLTAGGSSGGEGALVAMRGSILGVGTDIGGSIRIPSMCNGIYGIKPSAYRVPYSGQTALQLPAASKIGLQACAGPLTTSLRDCELFLKAVADQSPWDYDADTVFGHWSAQGSCRKKDQVVIGIVRTDGVIDPLPPIQNVMNDTVRALQAEGIKVVEMDITPVFSKCQSLANKMIGLPGGDYMFDLLDKTGEPLSPWLQGRMERKPSPSLELVRQLHERRELLRQELLQYWKDGSGSRIDAFICPVAPHPIPPIDSWNGVSYTSSFVLLDLPAGTIPVRPVRHSDLTADVPKSSPLSSWDRVNRELWTKVDRNLYLDSPLSIQVVAPRLQEKRLCEAMQVIDEALRNQLGSNSKVGKAKI